MLIVDEDMDKYCIYGLLFLIELYMVFMELDVMIFWFGILFNLFVFVLSFLGWYRILKLKLVRFVIYFWFVVFSFVDVNI